LKAARSLLQADYFDQMNVFPLPSTMLTPDFVAANVESAETKALLRDLRQPASQLLAAQGEYGKLHIFDQTSMLWLACATFDSRQ